MITINLAPLGNYGGPTQTMVPLPGSSAICAGLAANILTGMTTDQRGYPNTNTTYSGYSSSSPCVDSGAVQTNYSLSFTTAPSPISPATAILSNTNFQAAVTLDESGIPFTGGSASIPLTLTGTGTLSNATASTASGVASYSTLQVSTVGTGDTLTASLAVTGSASVSATSSTFNVTTVTSATVTLGSLNQTYSGSPLSATATTIPPGLTVTFTYNGSPTPPTAAGSYTVVGTVTSSGYQGSATGTLAISKATPTVTAWPSASEIYYSMPLFASTLTGGSASVPGSFALQGPFQPAVGTALQTAIFTPTDTTDYSNVTGSVSVTVGKYTPTNISAVLTSISYGQTLASSTIEFCVAYQAYGQGVSGTCAFNSPTTVPDAGTTAQGATFTPTDTTDYNTATGTINNVTVSQAPLSVIVNSTSVSFGSPIPLLAGTITGVVGNDGISASYSTTAVQGSAPGTYPITATLNDPNTRLFNYSVTNTPGTLTISGGAQGVQAHFSYAQVTLGGGFYSAQGVAVDASGNVFVADTNNNTVKEILAAGGYTTVNTLGSGFSSPFGVAVDASGNVFVADTNNSAVREILAAGGYTTVITLGSGFSSPYGVAVDSTGNVFVADTNNNAVKEILAAGGYTTVNTLGSGFVTPTGVAVDGSGNVFVADANNRAVKEILAAGGYTTVNTLGSGFVGPRGVAVDGSGNLFVADASSGVKELLAAGGYTTIKTLAGGLGPVSVGVDRSGNVFVADVGNNRVLELETAAGDFGTVAIGQTSATIPLTFTFDSGGNINNPVALTQGAAGLDFAVASGGTCTMGTYNTGDTCTVNVTFTPKFAGLRNGAVLLQDGSGNTLATGYVHGIGSGPQVSFLPGSQSTLGSGFSYPFGVAVDGSGNVFVADTYNNAVKEIPPGCLSFSCINTLGSGFAYPWDVTVDGSGNIFVADYAHNAVKEILAAGDYTTVNTLGSGFNLPKGTAVDGSGNLFVADYGNNAVKEILAAGGYTTIKTLGSGFSSPAGVAVDGSGNVFVADAGNNAVKEILAAGGYTTINTLGSGFSSPAGVSVDGNGNVFVADVGNNAVKEILAAGGYTTVNTLSSGFNGPARVAVDGSGNVSVADTLNSRVVKLDYSDAPNLSFGSVNVGVSSSEQMVTVQNIGNAPLNISQISAATNFNLGGSDTSCSSTGQTLIAAASCVLGIEFNPAAVGSLSGSVILTDNALNASATQQVSLSGTGVQTAAQVTVGTTPAGLSFSVDGTSYTTSQTLTWVIGSSHTLTTAAQSGAGTQYSFTGWSDGTTTLTDSVTASAVTTTYTAEFNPSAYVLNVTSSNTIDGTVTAPTSRNLLK
jgi:hypothetical protein